MDSLINQLCQLQDLILARDEHRQTGDGAHLARLTENIDTMVAELPEAVRARYNLLIRRNNLIVSPVSENSCAVCGMTLPASQVQAVRQCKNVQYCPGCSRVLYEDPNAPRWIGVTAPRTEPRKTGLSRFSAETLMVPDLVAGSAADAIEILAGQMEAKGFISHADRLIQAAMERETMLSTAMDNGLAFPHVRGVEGGSLTLACGVSKEPFTWDASGAQTNIVFLITIPSAVSAFYMRLLSGLTESFLKEANRKALINAETPTALWKALLKATRYTIK
jgi:mannitol/fructose-specific phosphotransferase system IIA component (Ntr-type)